VSTRDARKNGKGRERPTRRLSKDSAALAAIGIESEFAVVMDGQPVKPEDVFVSPTRIVRGPMMHRVGRSYHLPTGGAVYFDTGVIEIATPVIEIDRGCAARAGRSLWESIRFLRDELDAWQDREGHEVHLTGFSTHYNVSFEMLRKERGIGRSVSKLAMLLTHIMPVPVMLLAANRRSTGVGVRPRTDRIEVTADFTPDPALMIATATFVVAVARDVMTWPSFDLTELERHDIPVIHPFKPEPHSSRKGWVARFSSYDENPFMANIDERRWRTTTGDTRSLREIAARLTRYFQPSLDRFGDPRSLRLIADVMEGRTPSLLQLDDRPASYENVGHLCTWDNLFPVRALRRSRYERVFMQAISGRKVKVDRDWYTPTGMQGWSHVIFRRDRDKTRHTFSLDFLLDHLER
jgi:hypothetical protein